MHGASMPICTVMRDLPQKVPARARRLALSDHDAVAVRTVVVGTVAVAAPVAERCVVVPSSVAVIAPRTRLGKIDQRRSAFEAGIAVCVEPVTAGLHRTDELLERVQFGARQPASIDVHAGVAV